jgi:FkbM family methyltransferase
VRAAMRAELLYNPRLLCERLAIASIRRRRMARLRNTPAKWLSPGHVDSLELLDLVEPMGIGVIYDVGANVGTWTLLARAVLPGAEIHAFEPMEKHRNGFGANVAGLERVALHGIALGAENKPAVLHVMDFSDASSVLPSAEANRLHFGTVEVEQAPIQLHRLDDYRAAQQLPWPDLIKLDVQGYELEALKGGIDCLKSAKAVLAEVSFVEFYEGQPLFDDVVRFMADMGFRLHAVSATTPVGKPLLQTDVLFQTTAGGATAKVRP